MSNAIVGTVTATYAGISRSQSFAVVPPSVEYVGLSGASVLGGSSLSGNVGLTGPAPSTGSQLTFSTSSTAVVPVPPQMIVPAGARQANFNVATNPVAAAVSVTVGAFAGIGYSGPLPVAKLTVMPPTLQDFGVNPTTASYQVGSVDGFITLNGPAAAGTSVPLSWNSTDAASAPSSVPIPAGVSTATFKVTLKPVTAPTPFTLSALYGGRKTITLTVTP